MESEVVAGRHHTLPSLDDRLYALQRSIPHLARSAMRRSLRRYGPSRFKRVSLPAIFGSAAHSAVWIIVKIVFQFPVSDTSERPEEGRAKHGHSRSPRHLVGRFPAWRAPTATAATFPTLTGAAPLVIAHRGASGYLTEHTLASYELAMQMGADIIEPDLQLTRDGHLIAFHDASLLNDSQNGPALTDVAERFAPRNGGYLVADFDLAEIQSLTTFPRLTAGTEYPGFTPSAEHPFRIPTFGEVLSFLNDYNAANGTHVGIYPEAKTPNRTEMNEKIVTELQAYGFTSGEQPVYIQSFSYDALREIHGFQSALDTDMRQVALGGAMIENGVFGIFKFGVNLFHDFDQVGDFAEGLGVFIGNFQGQALSAEWIAAAHAAGFEVHGWTFRPTTLEAAFSLTQSYVDMGMDGFFTDFPDLTRQVIQANQITPIPLSASGLLLIGGLGGLLALRRRRR